MLKKVIISITGFTVVLVGVALIVLPGPAIIVIPAGLAILATEFVWARKLLKKMKDQATKVGNAFTGKKPEPEIEKKEIEN